MKEGLAVKIAGHVRIVDDLGSVLVDKKNAIHPENLARVISRALSNENNFFIERMAFGNGGTNIDAAQSITFNSPNNGVNDGLGWQSNLYNETYSEVVNENINLAGIETENPDFGSGPGTNPSGDPSFSAHNVDGLGVVSRPVGTLSEIRVQVTLNAGEPAGQLINDTGSVDTEGAYMFDEIGLFTTGLPQVATAGYQDVNVGSKVPASNTGLLLSTDYEFQIGIDGSSPATILFNSGSGSGGIITYQDLLPIIQGQLPVGSSIVELGSGAQTVNGQETGSFAAEGHNKFRFRSLSTGSLSTIQLLDGLGTTGLPLFSNLQDFDVIESAVPGSQAGIANDAVTPTNEGERMLTHVIFNPVLKSASRTLTINYTITVSLL